MKTVLSKLEAKGVKWGKTWWWSIELYFGSNPHSVTVTRIIRFLVGNPYKSLFCDGYWVGGRPKLYWQVVEDHEHSPLKLTSSHLKMDGWKLILALLGRQKAYFQGRWLPQVIFALNCYSKLFWDQRFVCFWREVEYSRSRRFKTGTKVRWLYQAYDSITLFCFFESFLYSEESHNIPNHMSQK